jgi:hypothetical protein
MTKVVSHNTNTTQMTGIRMGVSVKFGQAFELSNLIQKRDIINLIQQ